MERVSSPPSSNGQAEGLSPGFWWQRGQDPLGSARDLTYSQLPQGESLTPVHFKNSINGLKPRQSFVHHHGFNVAVAIVILLNSILIGVECEEIDNDELAPTYRTAETVFTVIYVSEILLRIWSGGCHSFFWSGGEQIGWNWFDFIITMVGAADLFVLQALRINTDDSNASVLRLLRVLRILRIFRILKFLKDVEYTLVSTLGSVVRVAFLVLLINYIGGVVITHALHDSKDPVIVEMFGRLSTSMLHLFEVMVDGMAAVYMSDMSDTPGGIVVITDKVNSVYPKMWMFWVGFVFVGTISLMALVPAIIVELNMRDAEIAKNTQDKRIWEQRVERQRDMLVNIFRIADTDNSNRLSWEEIDEALRDPHVGPDILRRSGLARPHSQEEISQLGYSGHDDPDEGEQRRMIDTNHLRMEFTRVYDALKAKGQRELSLEEFIEAFRHMNQKPTDQIVVLLQQEIFNLRTLMLSQNREMQDLVDEHVAEIQTLSNELRQPGGRPLS